MSDVYEASNVKKVEAKNVERGDHIAHTFESGDFRVVGSSKVRSTEKVQHPNPREEEQVEISFFNDGVAVSIDQMTADKTRPLPIVIDE